MTPFAVLRPSPRRALGGRARDLRRGGGILHLRRGAALLVTLVSLLVARAGRASAAASLIEWDAPAACRGALDVFGRLSSVLGYEPETLGRLSRVRGSVVQTATGYRLVLETFEHERRSSRLFEAASCDDLVDAATLAIALAMAPAPPDTALADSNAAREARSGSERSAAPLDVAPSTGNPPAAAPRLRPFAAANALLEYGALPRLGTGIAVGGGARLGALSLGGYGVLIGSERLRVAPAQDVEFDLLFGGLRACYALFDRALRFDACTAVEVGRFSALGLSLAPAREARDPWLAAGGALEAVWPLSGALGIQLRAEPMLPLIRKQYTVNGSENVHAPASLSSRLYLGLTLLSD
jgi:hypothetical protein